ncbi:SRPBCC family protein [Pseudomonas sp. C1C7]|uniref:SRPBCC family protein n=1 Tax=Pseudomonas sp. C1C7 TaxID=2735272 RepID=UPI0015867F99|nr:SRPBCC family protein [Pseudomonas sp. C1C7]NUT76854.1 SRPBCC family protein [Pseudomonas sp. C1C7]
MSEVRIWIAIERPVEQVWSLLGGFDWLPRWLDVIASSSLSDGGRLRHLQTANGATIVERLLTFDEGERYYSYALLEGPSPVIDYIGRMSAQSDGKGGTLASWSSSFVVQGADEAQVIEHFEVLYRQGLENLKAIIESSH